MDNIRDVILRNLWDLLGTAWSEFSEEEKEKFEKGWRLGYNTFSELLNAIIQHDGGFSLLTSRPFYTESGCYFSFYATTEEAKELLQLSTIPFEQYLSRQLIYTDSLIPLYSGLPIYYSGISFSNKEEMEYSLNPTIETGTLFYLTADGFNIFTPGVINQFWNLDPLTSGLPRSNNFHPYESGIEVY